MFPSNFWHSNRFLDVSVSVDNSGNITTDLYVKPTDTQQYLMATSFNPNHTKRSIPYSQALRICSSKESAKIRCSELVDCLAKRGYNKRKTNKQIEKVQIFFKPFQREVNVLPLALCTSMGSFTLVYLT